MQKQCGKVHCLLPETSAETVHKSICIGFPTCVNIVWMVHYFMRSSIEVGWKDNFLPLKISPLLRSAAPVATGHLPAASPLWQGMRGSSISKTTETPFLTAVSSSSVTPPFRPIRYLADTMLIPRAAPQLHQILGSDFHEVLIDLTSPYLWAGPVSQRWW